MPLELRDLTTNQTFEVPNEGLTFGREGGKADVQVKDNGVSKSHARVYADGEAWFLEDLGSANGTYLGDDRLAAPTEIMPNDVISMSKTRFEVIGPVGEGQGDQDQEAEPTPPPPPPRAGKPSAAPAAKKPPPKLASAGPAQSAARKNYTGTVEAGMGDAGGAEQKGIGYFVVAVPKAIAFYLAAVPLMLLNPIGTIRKGIAEQKYEAKGRMELIAYALPVLLFTAAVGFVASVIAGLVTHTLSVGTLLVNVLIVPAIVAVVASVVFGFIWHPFLNWFLGLPFLKADPTDDRSRTNMFLMVMTAMGLVALPSGLQILLGLIHLRVVGVLAPLLQVVVSLVIAFVFYSWMKHFNVVKWFQTVLLVLGALSAVFGVLGAITILTTPAGPVYAATGGGDAAQADDATGGARDLIKEGQAATKKAQAEAQAKLKEAQATGKAPPPPKDPEKPAKDDVKVAAVEPVKVEKPLTPPPPPPAPTPAPVEKSAPVTGSGYPAFAQMREAVEKRVTDDPTVLHNPAVLELYRDFEKDLYEIESKYQKATAKAPSEVRLNAHLRDSELYEKDEKKVKDLYGKLNK